MSPCNVTEKDGCSAGVAVSCRSHIGLADAADERLLGPAETPRFTMKHCGAMAKGGIHLGSAYMNCSVGIAHKDNTDILGHIATRLALIC